MTTPVPQALRLTSRQHPIVRRCRDVAANRVDEPVVLLDGDHLIRAAIESGITLEFFLSDGRHPALAALAADAGARTYEGTAAVLQAASPVRTPTGAVVVARWQPTPLADALLRRDALIVGLVDVQDPGNVGSVIRAADALGAAAVLALGTTADPGGWKSLRGAMGSTFRLPVARAATADALAAARRAGLRIVATVADAGTPIDQVDLRSPTLVLLGNEGAGLPESILELADLRLTIPMRSGADSLNVAVSAALLLFEARRQRASVTS